MARVLSDQQANLYVYIYSDDHVPAHVHVFSGRKRSEKDPDIKISLGDMDTAPEILEIDQSIPRKVAKEAWVLVAKNQEQLLREWDRIHGAKDKHKSKKSKPSKKGKPSKR